MPLRLEIAAIQAKPTYVGFKTLIFSKSAQADFVCVVANYIRPNLLKLSAFWSVLNPLTIPALPGLVYCLTQVLNDLIAEFWYLSDMKPQMNADKRRCLEKYFLYSPYLAVSPVLHK
ncbi:hypothetical protein WA1_25645 [Scytonema hofmannii PCC 7110]|uniref:Uncharacterized protein n=1 Tax=Scytonema hofmannii PCC 7110 TaxID=128403 RepID=A0A139X747_9CYAN|nr:hypothetical protein WA1_25645 [Scytonema hofmannii PCC 7110]